MGLVEWNVVPLATGAHHSGWPYCIADNRPYNNWDFVNSVPREWFDCSAPKNTSRHNTGLVELPPVVPADVWYGDRNCRTLAPEIALDPIDLSELPLGRHRLQVTVNDVAGNAATYTLRFVLIASFEDVDALIGRFAAAGSISSGTAARLRDRLSKAESAAADGRNSAAVGYLNEFIAIVKKDVKAKQPRTILVRDAGALIDQVKHGLPSAAGTGVTVTPAARPVFLPLVTPTRPAPNPGATYKILLVTGSGHNSIPDGIVAIQELGAENGFNVDLYDPAYPAVSLPASPFTSVANLTQYKTIVFFNSGNVTLDDSERAALQGYIRNGGGYAGIHDAGSTLRDWAWYGELAAGVFASHPQGPFSLNPPCEPCFPGVAVTEDHSHHSTRHLPERWSLVEEFHNYLVNPRAKVHVLMTLDEESYKHNLNVLKEGAWERGFNDLMGDHPISWCHNFEGGRAWFQGLGHNRELFHDPRYLKVVLGGIQTSAGVRPANCTSYKEVANLIASYQAEGAITEAAAAELQNLLNKALQAYLAKDPKAAAKHLAQLKARAATLIADTTVRTAITNKTEDLVSWMKSIRY